MPMMNKMSYGVGTSFIFAMLIIFVFQCLIRIIKFNIMILEILIHQFSDLIKCIEND